MLGAVAIHLERVVLNAKFMQYLESVIGTMADVVVTQDNPPF